MEYSQTEFAGIEIIPLSHKGPDILCGTPSGLWLLTLSRAFRDSNGKRGNSIRAYHGREQGSESA